MKSAIIQYLRRNLPRYRRALPVRILHRFCSVVSRLAENDNAAFLENGEAMVLRRVAASIPVACVFDVGANVGGYSRVAENIFQSATVHAFEPVPSTFAELERGAGKRTKVYNFGLSDKDEEMVVSLQPGNSGNATSHAKVSEFLNPTAARCDVVCKFRRASSVVEELASGSTIDFLKIDTEGHDWFVLSGLRELLAAGRIKVIQFEYGLSSIDTKKLLLDHYELLTACGFTIGKIFPTFVNFKDYHPLDEDFIGPNYLAVHRSVPTVVEVLRA